MIDFSNPPAVYWPDVDKVSYLQRRILIYSIMYYKLNESVVDDFKYEEISKQLVKMQKKLTKEQFSKTTYYYCMKNYNGSTGFDLYSKLTPYDKKHLMKIAEAVLKEYKKE